MSWRTLPSLGPLWLPLFFLVGWLTFSGNHTLAGARRDRPLSQRLRRSEPAAVTPTAARKGATGFKKSGNYWFFLTRRRFDSHLKLQPAVGEKFIAVVEVCGFHEWLVKWLQQDDGCHLVLVVQPLGRSAAKTDRRDANALSELLWVNHRGTAPSSKQNLGKLACSRARIDLEKCGCAPSSHASGNQERAAGV